jgi:hypothetical protein
MLAPGPSSLYFALWWERSPSPSGKWHTTHKITVAQQPTKTTENINILTLLHGRSPTARDGTSLSDRAGGKGPGKSGLRYGTLCEGSSTNYSNFDIHPPVLAFPSSDQNKHPLEAQSWCRSMTMEGNTSYNLHIRWFHFPTFRGFSCFFTRSNVL